MGGTLDSIFQRSPNTPAQVDMPATLGTADVPLLLLGTYTEYPSLWINVGNPQPLVVNGETFTDNGWTILAQIFDLPGTFSNHPTANNPIYQTLTDPTLSAVIAKLALPAANGALQKWSQAFWRMFIAS
jgi:hypothetical protein